MERLFDLDPVRISGFAPQGACQFDYLNRSDRDEAARVREVFEQFFQRYPAEARTALAARLCSPDIVPHISAAFELTVHELILRSGAKVLAVDTAVDNGKAPDFLVQRQDGSRVYIEAAAVFGLSPKEQAANRRLADVLDTIDAVCSRDFFWDVHYSGVPDQAVKVTKLRAAFEEWAATLRYDLVVAQERHRRPTFAISEPGLSLSIRPRPKQSLRGELTRGLGLQMPPAQWAGTRNRVREKINEKSKKYGDLDHPLVIAVNAVEDFFNGADLLETMLGDETLAVNVDTEETHVSRAPNGVWRFDGLRRRGLHAVFAVSRLTPWALDQRKAAKIINPHIDDQQFDLALPGDVWVRQSDGSFEFSHGKSIDEVLGLAKGWPELGEAA